MSLYSQLVRPSPSLPRVLYFRRLSSVVSIIPESQSSHRNNHEFLPPSTYIKSWKPAQNPKDAASQLALLRRGYAQKVKLVRKEYIKEMELLRIDKSRKDEARKEALRIANEQRKAAKDARKKAEAIERQASEEEFRKMLMKERLEKLEYWRAREQQNKKKKEESVELVRRKSSLWIDEPTLEKKLLEIMTMSTPL